MSQSWWMAGNEKSLLLIAKIQFKMFKSFFLCSLGLHEHLPYVESTAPGALP